MRGNTFVTDCLEATVETVEATPGETYKVGGGETASAWEVLRRLETITQRKAVVRQVPERLATSGSRKPIRMRWNATWRRSPCHFNLATTGDLGPQDSLRRAPGQ